MFGGCDELITDKSDNVEGYIMLDGISFILSIRYRNGRVGAFVETNDSRIRDYIVIFSFSIPYQNLSGLNRGIANKYPVAKDGISYDGKFEIGRDHLNWDEYLKNFVSIDNNKMAKFYGKIGLIKK